MILKQNLKTLMPCSVER